MRSSAATSGGKSASRSPWTERLAAIARLHAPVGPALGRFYTGLDRLRAAHGLAVWQRPTAWAAPLGPMPATPGRPGRLSPQEAARPVAVPIVGVAQQSGCVIAAPAALHPTGRC